MLLLLLVRMAGAEAPPLGDIVFEGELPFSESHARERAGLRKGAPLDPETAQAAAERLRRACILRHYPLARVSWQAFPTEKEERLTLAFRIEPGRQGRLRAVRFEGNRAFSARDLSVGLLARPRPGLWARATGRDILPPESLAQDRLSLLRRYRRAGHADAEIGDPRLLWTEALDGFQLTWPILHEGPSYRIGFIRFDADVLPPPAVLEKTLDTHVGALYDQARIEADVGALVTVCRQMGHAFAVADADVALDAELAQADILFRIHAGRRPQLRTIRVQGLEITDPRIVLREIALASGDMYDADALERAAVQVSILPMFSQTQVMLDGAADDPLFDIVVGVRECRTGRFEAGYTYGTDQGGAFQVQVQDRNLALTPPFRGQALQGTLGLTWGSRIVRVEASLINPRIGTSAWDIDGNIFSENNRYSSDYYRQQSQGGHLLSGRPLGRTQRITLGYEAAWVALYDVDEVWREAVGEYDDDVRLTSSVALWRMNRTDRLFRPMRGFRLQADLRAGTRALGGNTDVLRSRVAAVGYANPFGEHVTSLRAEASSVYPYGATERVPATLRLFRGGSDNLRGFEYRSISPLDDDGIPVGGQSGWLAAFEHLVPMGSRLDWAFYVEVGDIGVEAFDFVGDGPAANYGVGLLVRAHNFPVRFDAAVPFATVEGDKLNEKGKPRFSFSAGYRF